MNYWENKKLKAEKAKKHTKEMQEKYSNEIELSIKNTFIFENCDFILYKNNNLPKILLTQDDSVSAILKYHEGKTAVLNFASYKNPGGMFLKGSSAQEESLCHESNLYNVLSAFDNSYYAENRKFLNKGLYKNRALITPDIIFQRKDNPPIKCDVITCAAPNFSSANKYCNVSRDENNKALKSRIEFIYSIVEYMGYNTIILGAFGCGVFKQDPYKTAEYFKIFNYSSANKIIYAILPGANFDAFKKILI